MPMLPRTRVRRPWMPWVRVILVVAVVVGAGFGALELGQRYLGLQKLVIEQVTISGCRSERLAEIQRIANDVALHKPLFWFDAEELRQRIEGLRWVKSLLIRRDPPDRLSLVIEERKPLLWLVRPNGVYLLSDDGILLDRVSQSNLAPIPVVADPASETDQALVRLIRAASQLRDRQKDFYDRLTEIRWSDKGPVVYLEGVPAPIYLSRLDATQNIPNFQMLFLNEISKRPDLNKIRYFDLRWEEEVAVGEPVVDAPPTGKKGGK